MTEVNLATLFGVALVAGVGAYFGTYLREKGKNLATKEDIQVLTRKTEEIRTELSGGLWLEQRRWDMKRELYSVLLEGFDDLDYNLAVMAGARKDAATATAAGDQSRSVQFDELYETAREQAKIATRSIRRARAVGALFLSEPAQSALTDMVTSWTSALESLGDLVAARKQLKKVLAEVEKGIAEAGTADLFGLRVPR